LADSAVGRQAWKSLEAALETFWASSIADDHIADDQWKRTGSQFALWRNPELTIGGVSFRCPLVDGRVRAIVLTADFPEVVIPIHQACTQLHILGQVSFPLGYPLIGLAGETTAIYSLQYADGQTQTLPIRNGVEVAQSNCIDAATRIAPIATAAQPAVEYVKDRAREHYQILLFRSPPGRKLWSIYDADLIPLSPPWQFLRLPQSKATPFNMFYVFAGHYRVAASSDPLSTILRPASNLQQL